MKYHIIDNSLKNLGKTVLWQYDRAKRLLAVLKHMQVLYHCAVEQFWDFWTRKVLSIDTCGELGCSMWGHFLGVPRPSIIDPATGEERLIAASVYRRILKGAFYLMKASSSFKDILGYIEIVFGVGGHKSLTKWSAQVSEFGWTTNIDELNGAYSVGKVYVPGDIVWHRIEDDAGNVEYDGNWKFKEGDYTIVPSWDSEKGEPPEGVVVNNSWEDIAPYVVETEEDLPQEETLLLKLYDPKGVCRKIGGGPADSLSISVSYEFGNTTITAIATRQRKCGISLVDHDNMSMTYEKSSFFEEMHRDQKLLFDQKLDEICPYPLGIKSNAPIPEWILGCKGQENIQYHDSIAYAVGKIFGYADDKGNCYNYICKQPISVAENTGFDAIKDKLEITKDGDPFIGGLVETKSPITSTFPWVYFHVVDAQDLNRWREVFKGLVGQDHITSRLKVGFEDFMSMLNKMVDVSTLHYPTWLALKRNELYTIQQNGLRLIALSRFPEERIAFSDGQSVQLVIVPQIDETFFKPPSVFYYYFTTPGLLTSPFNAAILDSPSYMDFLEAARINSLRNEIERALGAIAEHFNWQIIDYAESQRPMEGIAYAQNSTFKIDGQDKYLDGGVYKMLAKTTLPCESTLKQLG